MTWSRKLPRPIYLNDGRTIGTLAAARDLMLSLSPQRQNDPHWLDAAALLLQAARVGRLKPVGEAGAQVSRVLEVEGLI